MSVQAGIWRFDGGPVERRTLAAISSQTAEFGPDGEEIRVAGNIGMLYRPFHTTAESRTEQQPHCLASGTIITWDGRLDNRVDLLAQLGSCLNRQSTDLEIVAAAYEKWASGCFPRLLGDWSLALWDANERALILARDYIGVKRLFYYPQPICITWCSHLEGLVFCGDSFSLCEDYIAPYLTLRLPSHLTPYRELHSVPAGNFVAVRHGSITRHRYWSPAPQRLRYKTDADYEEHFRHLFRQAVRRRLRSQSPVLAELSGGLDSSSIVCMADNILADEKSAAVLATFSYNYPDETEGDDSRYIRIMQKRRGATAAYRDIPNSGDSFIVDQDAFLLVPSFGARKEAEIARSQVVERGGYRVVLTGIGGDEFMGGALNSRVQLADLLLRGRWMKFHKLLLAWATFWRYPYAKLLMEVTGMILPAAIRIRGKAAGDAHVPPWINRTFARKTNLAAMLLPAFEGSLFRLPTERDAYQTYTRLSGILTNLAPAVHEPRYPCLDQTLTEFLTSVPSDQLLRVGERRSLMRRALAGILPDEILARWSKQSDGGGYITTLAKHWERLTPILNSPQIAQLGYVDGAEFKLALATLKSTRRLEMETMMLLRALFLELWLRGALKHQVLSPQIVATPEARNRWNFAPKLSVS